MEDLEFAFEALHAGDDCVELGDFLRGVCGGGGFCGVLGCELFHGAEEVCRVSFNCLLGGLEILPEKLVR